MYVFNVGDKVTWSSQARGRKTTKLGTVVAVVPARMSPREYMVAVYKTLKGRLHRMDGGGVMRNHVSYLVLVAAEGNGKPRLYWPVVSRLKEA